MQLLIFEDDSASNLWPLTLGKPTFMLRLGPMTLLQGLEKAIGRRFEMAVVRPYLREVTELWCGLKAEGLETEEEDVVLLNGLTKPYELEPGLLRREEPFVALTQDGRVVVSKLGRKEAKALLGADFKDLTKSLLDLELDRLELKGYPLIRYPWELVEELEAGLLHYWRRIQPIQGGSEVKATIIGDPKNIRVEERVELEPPVILNVKKGPIIIEGGVRIEAFTRIEGPCYIGRGSIIRSALIRGPCSFGEESRVGGEVEATVMEPYTNKAHSGFLGHSYLGSWVNVGAMSTTSDLKNTYGSIRMKVGEHLIDTGLTKVGCFIAEHAKLSIGTLVNSGRRIGYSSHVAGFVVEDVPSFTMKLKGTGIKEAELDLESALRTQERMMRRRGLVPRPQEVELMRRLFELTREERKDLRLT